MLFSSPKQNYNNLASKLKRTKHPASSIVISNSDTNEGKVCNEKNAYNGGAVADVTPYE